MATERQAATEVQWSDLQRDPKSVERVLAEEGQVRVRRRDGSTLLLVREDRATEAAEGAAGAARMLRALAESVPTTKLAEAIAQEFVWIDVLPAEDRTQCVVDVVRAFRVSAELGNWRPFHQVVHGWKETAAIWTDPELVAKLSSPIKDDFGLVPNPQEM